MSFKRYDKLFILIFALFLVSIIIDQIAPGKYTSRGVVSAIQLSIKKQENDFRSFCKGSSISQILSDSLPEKQLKTFLNKDYFIFIFDAATGRPVIWNTQSVVCDSNIIFGRNNNYVSLLSNGWYLVEKKFVTLAPRRNLIVVALMPVKNEYYVSNNYLHNSFHALEGIEDRFYISKVPTKISINNSAGQRLFYLGQKSASLNSYNNWTAIVLRIFSILIFFFVIHHYAKKLVSEKGILYGVLFLFFTLLILRIVSYIFPFPFNFRQFELFSSSIYGSNFILKSLGDLFINVFLFEWFIFFLKDYVANIKVNYPQQITRRVAITILLCLAMLGFTILCGFILNTLVSDSQISFDVLNFFSLNIYTVIGFIILCGIASVYFFTMQLLLKFLQPLIKENIYLPAISIIVSSLIVLSLLIGDSHFIFYFLLIGWLWLFLFLLNNKNLYSVKTKIISAKIIFWIFFFSISMTMVIISENNRKELENRKRYLENIADKTDPSGERMMSITLADLKDDYLPFIFDRFRQKNSNYFLKDSLLHENFQGYLNKYETKIYTFDSLGNPLFNPDSTSLNTLNVIFETQSHATSTPNLSYYDVSFERFNYITRKIVKNQDNSVKGYLIIISTPKRYKADELYPQLFNKGNSDAIENSPVYSYGIYINKYLVNSYNDYPFPTHLPKEINFYTNFYERSINGYSELWYRVNGTKYLVITKPDNINIEAITLFAYLFCAFLATITLINFLILVLKSKLDMKLVFSNIQLTVRNQVHGTIILISIISFIIIGVTTILFFISRYNKNEHEKLSRTINIIENDIVNSMDSSLNFSYEGYGTGLLMQDSKAETTINHIAEVHGSDINIYDLNGKLQISSLPLPYNKGILSNLMDPLAYYHLNKVKDAQYFRLQNIGDLQYLNNYIPLRNKNGKEVAYLNIPFFESQNKLYEEISNFLVTIINLNAFIFLIAGILAFFITNRITNSFFFISEKMKEVNLGKTNELIKWKRKDEIGELVKEYNRMVMKLEESAQVLARNEREGAWREMARQVAHEIKNPLTPMKLNLQYLQMAIDNKSPNVIDISLYVTKILVEQIDHLSQIASDFSQFADINHSHNQQFDVNEILNKLYLLYAGNSNLKIEENLSEEPLTIYADKTQVQRLFTNLIQNAVQSIPENRKPFIQISSKIEDDNVLTQITDNGSGIPEKMQGKIFTPNFTTKSSGTGLGLAMCKGIVEKIGGRIWFETSSSGTSFFVEIPLEK